MRKWALGIIFTFFAFACLFSACSKSVIESNYSRIADYRYAALRYTCENYTVDIVGGVRELPYSADGVASSDKTEYTVFTLTPAEGYAVEDTLPLKVTLGGEEHSVYLAPHPFRDSYSVEIAVAPSGDELNSLTFNVGDEEVTAVSTATDIISGESALELAFEYFNTRDVSGEGELFIRLTENNVSEEGGWYWYVADNSEDQRVSVLIDASTGEIRATGG